MVDSSTPHWTTNPSVPQTLHEVLLPHIQATPDRPALLTPGGSPLTYAGLGRQVTDTLAACRTLGLGRQDRVALVLPNGPEMAAAFVALCVAAACAPLNPRYREEDFEFAFTDFGVSTVVVQAGVASPARDVARTLGLPVSELHPQPELGCGAFRLEAEPFGPATLPGPSCAQDVALVLHTSGTTARPKIVPLSQANLTGAMRGVAGALELTCDDRCLNVMPLFHVHGLIGALLSSLCVGGSVICAPGPSATEFFGWMDSLSPTWYTAVPTIHQAILGVAPAHRKVIVRRPLRFLRSCSAPLPPSVLGQLEQTFAAPVLEAYGMTEATHLMACNPLPPRRRKPGSVGLPTGTELAIMDMDQEGRLLGPNEIGEVVARGETITSGYESNLGANESSFAGGWFHTGDQGYRDEDGYYYLTGRLKELINRGGEKVAPREIDDALTAHPQVSQAIAFAVPDEILGEDIVAAVVPREGCHPDPDELVAFAARQLADYKVPREVILVDELPRGATGKLQRIGLADKLGHLLTPQAPEALPELADDPEALSDTCAGVQALMTAMWEEVLGARQPDPDRSFFEQGGDSLKATRLAARYRTTFGVPVTLRSLFDHPTLSGQAEMVTRMLLTEVLTGGEAPH